MSAVRKYVPGEIDRLEGDGTEFPPEAFDYDEPLNEDAIRRHADEARRKHLADREWRVVDGIDWGRARELVEKTT